MAYRKKQQQRNTHGSSLTLGASLSSKKNEKDQMIDLNNRMATYIENVQSQGFETSRLKMQLLKFDETSFHQTSNVKAIYESELSEARLLLDQLSKEKAQLQVEANSFQQKLKSESDRANGLTHDNGVLESKLKDADALLSSKTALCSRMQKERDALCRELDNLRLKLTDLQQELGSTQGMLEAEALQRVDFENKLQSAKEELLLNERVHREELAEMRRRHAITINELDERSKEEYSYMLEAAIIDLRKQQDADRQRMKEDLEEQHGAKVGELQKQVELERKSRMQSLESSKASEIMLDRLRSSMTSLQSQNNNLSNRVQDLEGQVETEREFRLSAMLRLEEERDEIQAALTEKEKRFIALLETKLQLDQEIAVYRKLLEEGEKGFNLTLSSGENEGKRKTETRRKRKRVVLQSTDGETLAKRKELATTYSTETVTVEQSQPQAKAEIGEEAMSFHQFDPSPGRDNTCIVM